MTLKLTCHHNKSHITCMKYNLKELCILLAHLTVSSCWCQTFYPACYLKSTNGTSFWGTQTIWCKYQPFLPAPLWYIYSKVHSVQVFQDYARSESCRKWKTFYGLALFPQLLGKPTCHFMNQGDHNLSFYESGGPQNGRIPSPIIQSSLVKPDIFLLFCSWATFWGLEIVYKVYKNLRQKKA